MKGNATVQSATDLMSDVCRSLFSSQFAPGFNVISMSLIETKTFFFHIQICQRAMRCWRSPNRRHLNHCNIFVDICWYLLIFIFILVLVSVELLHSKVANALCCRYSKSTIFVNFHFEKKTHHNNQTAYYAKRRKSKQCNYQHVSRIVW